MATVPHFLLWRTAMSMTLPFAFEMEKRRARNALAAGFEPRFAVEGGEMDAVLRFVEAGLGIAVVPSMVLAGRPGLRGTPLVLADEEARRGHHGPGLLRTIALAHRKDVDLTHAARAFQDLLMTFLVEAGAAGDLPAGVESLVRD